MKKEELTQRFNSLVTAEKLDLDAARTLLTDIEKDYDDHASTVTTLETFKADNKKLTDDNADLRKTNMKFYMLISEQGQKDAEDDSPDDTKKEQTTDEHPIEDILSAMLGKSEKGKEGNE